jgi:L-lactate dehydrogenase (cytochrome)
MAKRFGRLLALDDMEDAARRVLPRLIFGYIAGAVERGQSFRDNQAAFLNYAFRPRVLVDTAQRSQAVSLFGRTYRSPFGVAPMGGAVLAAPDGDCAMARAAAGAGIPFILSGASLTPLERVCSAGGAPWFQAYLPGDPQRILPLVDRVATAGYETLVVTVDVPILGNRENNLRVGFSMPLKPTPTLIWQLAVRPGWLARWGTMLLRSGMPHFENMEAQRGPPVVSRSLERNLGGRDRLSWPHIELIRKHWPGTLVIKGLLRGEDARAARDRGVDGIIVSNHGGRQLDGAVAPLRALPEVIEAAGETPVMLDGGLRRGTDVLKALALGARFVFVGRPFLFAAAIGGEAAVAHAISILAAEIDRDMALLGLTDPSQITADFLARS